MNDENLIKMWRKEFLGCKQESRLPKPESGGRPKMFLGRPPNILGRPPKFLGCPPKFLGRPPKFLGRPPKFLGRPPDSGLGRKNTCRRIPNTVLGQQITCQSDLEFGFG